MPQNPGARDRAVRVEQLTPSTGTSRLPVENWTELAPIVWMSKTEATVADRARERFIADQLSAPYETIWETAYRADLDPELLDVPKTRRLVYQNRIYNVVSAAQIERRASVRLLTTARQG